MLGARANINGAGSWRENTLPFAKISVSTLMPGGGEPVLAAALLDSGASIGLVQYDFLATMPEMPEIRKTRTRASAFTGTPINIIGITTLKIDFGIGVPAVIDLYVHDGKTEPKILLSWRDFSKIGLILDAKNNTAQIQG